MGRMDRMDRMGIEAIHLTIIFTDILIPEITEDSEDDDCLFAAAWQTSKIYRGQNICI
jgi:hypothetical protein